MLNVDPHDTDTRHVRSQTSRVARGKVRELEQVMSSSLRGAQNNTLALASEAHLCAAWSEFGCPLPGELYDRPEFHRIVSGLPSAFWNSVYRAKLDETDVDASISRALGPFRERAIPMYWWVTCSTQPADLGRRLEKHGLQRAGIVTDMFAELGAIPESTALQGVTITEVQTAEELLHANLVLMAGFGLPEVIAVAMTAKLSQIGVGDDHRWHVFLARLNGRPVATSALFSHQGLAGIYNVATVPDARGRGIGSAVTLTAMHAARTRGHRIAVLHATDQGLPIYHRLGFVEQYTIELFGSPP